MQRAFILTIAVVLLAGCQCPDRELTEDERAEIEAGVRQATRAEWDVWQEKRDIDAYMAFFSDWSVAPFPSSTSVEDFRSGILELWSELRTIELAELTDVRVRVLGRRAAAVEGRFEQILTDTAGAVEEWKGTFTWVWVLEDGRWKILAGKNNPLPDGS